MIAAVYVNSPDLPSIYYKQEFSMVGGNMEHLKNNRTVKIGQWALAHGWALAWTMQYVQ